MSKDLIKSESDVVEISHKKNQDVEISQTAVLYQPGQTLPDLYPALLTQAQVTALTKVKVTDFKAGLIWYFVRRIGTINTGTAQAPVYEDRFEPVVREVHIATINQDLMDLQMYITRGNAYTNITPGAPVYNPTPTMVESIVGPVLEKILEIQEENDLGVKELSREEAFVDKVFTLAEAKPYGQNPPQYIFPEDGGKKNKKEKEEAKKEETKNGKK